MISATTFVHHEHVGQEDERRLIVRLVFIVFLLLIFEGALRKWALPDLQRPLYFSRDPFVALIYVCVLLNGLILRSRMLIVLGLFAVPVSVFHLLLVPLGVGRPIAWALGVRHYFFYIPLAFIIGRCFRFDDLAALIRLNLLLAIPIAVLVFVQYRSVPAAAINRSIAGDVDGIARVAGDMVRPYGTFAYTSGQVFYTAVSVSMLATAWVLRPQMRLPLWLLVSSTGATMFMALTTGSRAVWLFYIFTLTCLAAAALSTTDCRQSLRMLSFVLLVVLAGVTLYTTLLAPAYDAMLDRYLATGGSTSISTRLLDMFTHAFDMMRWAPIQGFGLGSGILGAVAAITGERHFALAETEWDRIVLELGPVFGLGFIVLRLVLIAWLLRRALLANRMFGNPAGLILFGFVGPHLLVGQITMSGEGAMFAWLFVGFLIAATNATLPTFEAPTRLHRAENELAAETRRQRSSRASARGQAELGISAAASTSRPGG
jgi:hypothetical protein